MKTKLFNTLFAAVVAGAVTLAGSTVVYAAPLPQDQSMQKPSAGVEIAQDQDTAPVQAPPQDQAAPPQPPEQAPPAGQAAPQDQNQAPPPDESNGGYAGRRQYSQLSGEQLHQLVAPIALYPDALVAQILAAAAYPTQIVEAHRFLQQNPDLKGQALGDAVDQQDWDPSVKALCQFPSVVANMDRDLSWTQELGDANYNQSADVMAAIQLLRHKAYDAGNLRTTPQERVSEQGPDVDIQPADPDVVYVPTYNPAYVYGYPVGLWPGFYPWWGVGFGGPFVSFGFGFPIAPFFGFGWGWHGWGIGWGFDGGIFFGGHPYAWRGAGFYNHAAFVHGNYRGFNRGGFGARGFGGRGYASSAARGFSGSRSYGANRGYAANRSYAGANRGYEGRSSAGTRSVASNRGAARGYSSRGNSGGRSDAHSSSHASGGG